MRSDPLSKILILGGSSYVGRQLTQQMQPNRFLVTYNSNPIEGGVKFDAGEMVLEKVISSPDEFSHAIMLLGDTQPDSCFSDPVKSQKINVDGLKKVIDFLNRWSIKPIFTSTEFVFDGKTGNNTEEISPNPILLYGAQKLAMENYIQENSDDYLIFRFAKIFGNILDDSTLFSGWMRAILNGVSSIQCASDQYFSPVYIQDVINIIQLACSTNHSGLYNLSCGERKSRIELLEMFLTEVNTVRSTDIKIEPCSILDYDLPEPRPLDVSMSCKKLISHFDYTPQDIRKTIRELVQKWQRREN
jgi:dTDP-4-dehydrorhamnose reductase